MPDEILPMFVRVLGFPSAALLPEADGKETVNGITHLCVSRGTGQGKGGGGGGAGIREASKRKQLSTEGGSQAARGQGAVYTRPPPKGLRVPQSAHLRQRTAMTMTTRTSTTPTTAVPAIRASCSRQLSFSGGEKLRSEEADGPGDPTPASRHESCSPENRPPAVGQVRESTTVSKLLSAGSGSCEVPPGKGGSFPTSLRRQRVSLRSVINTGGHRRPQGLRQCLQSKCGNNPDVRQQMNG